MNRRFLTLLWSALSLLGSCVTNSEQTIEPVADPYHDTAIIWHQGSIDAAFQRAKEQKKLVFLYWGAKWCPPCNELKSQVFVKPQFVDAMKAFIPVYLDGDTDYAQAWGEHLQVSGYPTILILDSHKNELLRISEGLDISEFQAVINTVVQANTNFRELVDTGINGSPTREHWQLLAYYSWAGGKDVDLSSDEFLEKRLQLALRVPKDFVEERALLSAKLLETVASPSEKSSPVKDNIRAQAGDLIAAMMVDENAIFAARSTLILFGKDITEWVYQSDAKKKRLMRDKWLTAAQRLGNDKRISIDQKLWSLYPAIQFYKTEHPSAKKLPADMIKQLREAVSTADKASKTPMERQSVVPGAGYLLAEGLLFDDAYALLEGEADNAKAPFYFYSTLARIAEISGDQKKSMQYTLKASSTVEGKATKLQWLENDIQAMLKIPEHRNSPRVTKLLEQYYDTLFSTKDGFNGRSYRSVKKVGSLLGSTKKNEGLHELIKNYSVRCHSLESKEKMRCEDHFKAAQGGA